MKEAMWGVGFIILAIFGIFLISLFGNITVTNQQDYTAMKNTVEAAMNDAIDMGLYRTGFCVCSNQEKNDEGKWVFKSSNDYEISTLVNGSCESSTKNRCDVVEGEYIIDKKVFSESLVRRFAESVKGNYNYQIIVEDVIEYPPKVSVNIKSTNNNELDGEEYTIDNRIDAIIEMNSEPYVGDPYTDIPDIDEDKCNLDDITCDEKTGKCYDKSGTLCFEKPIYEEKDEKCKAGDIKCISTGNSYTVQSFRCTDSKGNFCGSGVGNIPKVPRHDAPAAVQQRIYPTAANGCFLASTKVPTKYGYKDIDKLKVGDYVLTFNEGKNINEYKKIRHVFIFENIDEELYTIKTDNAMFSLTHRHRVYTLRDGKYVYIPAEELNIGDVLRYADGKYHRIVEISSRSIKETVYNLELEDNHNFYVSENMILVHNNNKN